MTDAAKAANYIEAMIEELSEISDDLPVSMSDKLRQASDILGQVVDELVEGETA